MSKKAPKAPCSMCGAMVRPRMDRARNGDILRLCFACWVRRHAWKRLTVTAFRDD